MREIFLKIGKWLTPTIKDKQVTYSNLSLKQWKERKYGTEWIPMKIFNKGLKFLDVKTVKDITNHLLRLEKLFFHSSQCLFIPVLLSILGPWRFVRNLPPHKQIKTFYCKLQTVKLIICLNWKVFIKFAVNFRNV